MEEKYKAGDVFTYNFSFTQNDVITFSHASGDYNPIHLDKEYAARTIFKRTIIHGFLGGSVFSKVFGTIYPGRGTIYLKQNMSFLKPMYTQTPYKAIFTIINIFQDKNRALVKTDITDNNGILVISGEALIKHPDII